MTPPNTRVQRTRSSPSALRSPLTRSPLGGVRHARLLGAAAGASAIPASTLSPSFARRLL
jgi:hypothetical protein